MEETRAAHRPRPLNGSIPRIVILLLTLLAPGSPCVAAEESCTIAGGSRWRHYRSRHFVFDVAARNLDPALLVKTFEELHAAVLAALVSEPVEIPGRVHVVVLPREGDLFDYTGDRSVMGAFWISRFGEPTILVSAEKIRDVPYVVAHELAHHISSYLFPRQAYWFSEGLAQFVESVAKIDRDGKRWTGGDPSSGSIAGSIKLTRMEVLVGGGDRQRFDANPYVTAWVLYRFLWNERSAHLAQYQRRLMEGDSPPAAWNAAFPEWNLDSGKIGLLDGPLHHHQVSGRGLRWEIKLGPVDTTFTSAPVSYGDVHLALLPARLNQVNSVIKARMTRTSLEEAEREDPDHPVVRFELARIRGEPLGAALQAVTAARPTDGRGWFLLARQTEDLTAREAALRRAAAYWPEGALAKAALASHLAATGRAREALAFANDAADLAPWSPVVVSTLATVAAELGKCKEALILQERAVDAAMCRSFGSTGSDPTQLKERLTELRKRCAPPSGAR